MKTIFLIACPALCMLLPLPAADKAASGSDPDLPQPLDLGVAQTMLDSSPFTRTLNLSDSLVLTGIAHIHGKPVATLLDKSKGKSYVVSDTPNAEGWKLAEANSGVPISRAQAKIYIGSETVIVRYGRDQLAPEEKKQKSSGPDVAPPAGAPPRREYHRPSEEDRRRFEALSDKAKEKIRDFFRDSREKLMNATPEERTNFIRSNFERIEKEDKSGK
jgi:hypothetical protein